MVTFNTHYLDQALEEYVTDLKKKGLYDDSVIMIYGDHYGISENHNNAMEKLLGEKITPRIYGLKSYRFLAKNSW